MQKKSIAFFITFLFLLSIVGLMKVEAEEWTTTDVKNDKVWTVTFNTEMEPKSINDDTIYITNSDGDRLTNMDLILDYSMKKVRVDYEGTYDYGEEYELVVTDEVKAESGEKAVSASSMSFSIEQNTEKTTTEIVSEVDEKVVTIQVENSEYASQGSGVVVGEGLILTNHHVVNGMNQGTVHFTNGEVLEVEGIVEMSAEKDLALIKTKETFDISPVAIGTVNSLSKGDSVIAIGSPNGLSNTASQGGVSAFREENGVQLIQTDAEIDHGSSGGGLFNKNAELVGITSSGLDTNAALNFAVAIDESFVWDEYFTMSHSSIPVNYPLTTIPPTPEPGEPANEGSFSYGDVFLGMTKEEVIAAEDGTLIEDVPDQLFFTNTYLFGYDVDVLYNFENNQLNEIFISLYGVEYLTFDELELLFTDLYTNMEQSIGEADQFDLEWFNDNNDYRLSAVWLQSTDVILSVAVDEYDFESSAGILIQAK